MIRVKRDGLQIQMKQINKAHETRRRFTLGLTDIDEDDKTIRNQSRILINKIATMNQEDGARYVERSSLERKMTSTKVNNILLADNTFPQAGSNLYTSRKSV